MAGDQLVFLIHSFCFARGFFFCCGMGELGGGAVTRLEGNCLGVLGCCFLFLQTREQFRLFVQTTVHMSQINNGRVVVGGVDAKKTKGAR